MGLDAEAMCSPDMFPFIMVPVFATLLAGLVLSLERQSSSRSDGDERSLSSLSNSDGAYSDEEAGAGRTPYEGFADKYYQPVQVIAV